MTHQLEYVKCGKERCRTCRDGQGHGPYWYEYTRNGAKLTKRYIGKALIEGEGDMKQYIYAGRNDLAQIKQTALNAGHVLQEQLPSIVDDVTHITCHHCDAYIGVRRRGRPPLYDYQTVASALTYRPCPGPGHASRDRRLNHVPH